MPRRGARQRTSTRTDLSIRYTFSGFRKPTTIPPVQYEYGTAVASYVPISIFLFLSSGNRHILQINRIPLGGLFNPPGLSIQSPWGVTSILEHSPTSHRSLTTVYQLATLPGRIFLLVHNKQIYWYRSYTYTIRYGLISTSDTHRYGGIHRYGIGIRCRHKSGTTKPNYFSRTSYETKNSAAVYEYS
jgi:hypothetical protein